MRLLIVDDEELTRTGVITSLDWAALGVGSFLSFLVGTGIKLVAAVGMLTFVVADTWPALRAWFATVF